MIVERDIQACRRDRPRIRVEEEQLRYLVESNFRGFSWIEARGFSKNPSVQKLWREKANSYSSPRAVFAHFETQELLEAQPVSRILLQTLATGAAGVK